MPDEQHGRALRYVIAAAAAVTAAYVGSLAGVGGTLIGTGAGAVISGAAAELYGHLAGRARHHARAVPAWKRWNPPRLDVTRRVAVRVAAGAAVFCGAAYGTLWALEAATGRPLHAITTGSSQRGTSFTGTTPGVPAPVPSPSPSPSASSVTPSPSASVTVSPSAAVTPSVSPSVRPPVTPAAVSPSPDVTATTPQDVPPPSLLPTSSP